MEDNAVETVVTKASHVRINEKILTALSRSIYSLSLAKMKVLMIVGVLRILLFK